MGIDYYFENSTCHDWQEKTKVNIMKLHSIEEWLSFLKDQVLKILITNKFVRKKLGRNLGGLW